MLLSGTCSLPRWGLGKGKREKKMKAQGEGKVWHKQITNRWCDMWKCESWQQEGCKKKKKKTTLLRCRLCLAVS